MNLIMYNIIYCIILLYCIVIYFSYSIMLYYIMLCYIMLYLKGVMRIFLAYVQEECKDNLIIPDRVLLGI